MTDPIQKFREKFVRNAFKVMFPDSSAPDPFPADYIIGTPEEHEAFWELALKEAREEGYNAGRNWYDYGAKEGIEKALATYKSSLLSALEKMKEDVMRIKEKGQVDKSLKTIAIKTLENVEQYIKENGQT